MIFILWTYENRQFYIVKKYIYSFYYGMEYLYYQ